MAAKRISWRQGWKSKDRAVPGKLSVYTALRRVTWRCLQGLTELQIRPHAILSIIAPIYCVPTVFVMPGTLQTFFH